MTTFLRCFGRKSPRVDVSPFRTDEVDRFSAPGFDRWRIIFDTDPYRADRCRTDRSEVDFHRSTFDIPKHREGNARRIAVARRNRDKIAGETAEQDCRRSADSNAIPSKSYPTTIETTARRTYVRSFVEKSGSERHSPNSLPFALVSVTTFATVRLPSEIVRRPASSDETPRCSTAARLFAEISSSYLRPLAQAI